MCRLAIVPPNLLDRTQQKLKELSTAGCINFKTESFFEKKQGIRKTEGRPLISLDFEPTLEEIKLKGYEFDWVSDAKHNRGTMFIAQTGAISSRILLDSLDTNANWGKKRPKIPEKDKANFQQAWSSGDIQEIKTALKKLTEIKRTEGLNVVIRGLSTLAPHIREEVLKEMKELSDTVSFVMLDYRPFQTSFEHTTIGTLGMVENKDYQVDVFKVEQ